MELLRTPQAARLGVDLIVAKTANDGLRGDDDKTGGIFFWGKDGGGLAGLAGLPKIFEGEENGA